MYLEQSSKPELLVRPGFFQLIYCGLLPGLFLVLGLLAAFDPWNAQARVPSEGLVLAVWASSACCISLACVSR